MTPEECVEFLDGLPAFTGSGDFNLDPVMRLLALCGNPERTLPPTIHVTGTNGKGSVVAFTSSLLRFAGYKVAAFTSPHPSPLYSDNLTMEGCEKGAFETAVSAVKSCLKQYDTAELVEEELPLYLTHLKGLGVIKDGVATKQRPSQFEVITVACIYAVSKVVVPRPDFFVVEVGLGGRLDSTNIIPPPRCCAFTSIDRDHVKMLGDTPEKICLEKSGIIKPGVSHVVTYPQQPGVSKILRGVAENCGVGSFTEIPLEGKMTPMKLSPERHPSHVIRNYLVAHSAVELVLEEKVAHLGMEELSVGKLMGGRFEAYDVGGHFVVFDGAHNPQAVGGLVEHVGKFVEENGVAHLDVVLGVLSDKDIGKMAASYLPLASLPSTSATFYPVAVPATPRTLPAPALHTALSLHIPPPNMSPPTTLSEALPRLLPLEKKKKTALLITGSFYLLKAAREAAETAYGGLRTRVAA